MSSPLKQNTTTIQELLNTINSLPEAGGVELPELSNPATAEEVFLNKEFINEDGNSVTGTFSIDNELTTQDSLIAQIQAAVDSLPEVGSAEPVLQDKTVTPTTSSQNVTPDSGYDGLSKVTVNAIPTADQATPSISVSSNGLITASATQTAGYVAAGTKSGTKQLTTQAAKTITPSTNSKTAVASGVYTTGAVTVAAIPSTYVKPTSTKTATTYTPTTSNQTIAAGTYCSGVQTIKGDANLKAENIADGVSIFGVTGTHSGGSSDSIDTCKVTIPGSDSGLGFVNLIYTAYEDGKVKHVQLDNQFIPAADVIVYPVKNTLFIAQGMNDAQNAISSSITGEYTQIGMWFNTPNTHFVIINGDCIFKYAAPCFVRGTQITLSNRTTKAVQDITYEDELLVWDFDNGCYTNAKPLWIMKKQSTDYYYRCEFDNGVVLKLVGSNGKCHRLFNVDTNSFESATDCVGNMIMTMNGVCRLLSCERIDESVEFYNIITEFHLNLFADSVLTSCRLNNLYMIENMRFIKEERPVIDKSEYVNMDRLFYDGLRLKEQKAENIDMINKYIQRLQIFVTNREV